MAESLRRLRQNRWVRELVQEVKVSADQMIQPLFGVEYLREREPLVGLTEVYRDTPDSLLRQIERDLEAGVRKFLLFGIPRDKRVSDFNFDFTAELVRCIKSKFGKDLFLAVDVCLCSFTTHGHCGILNLEGDHVENDRTAIELSRAAVAYARAGADCVAPSDMMDGRVRSIREALDGNGFHQTLLLSYSAKFHSSFYGPFRIAADSAPRAGLKDRATYQIDASRYTDARLSSIRDAEEGADLLMVKPGLPYLDILFRLKQEIPRPWVVYEVSGEYAAIELMSERGLIQAPEAHLEAWTAFVRAGASAIITYGARNAREWLMA